MELRLYELVLMLRPDIADSEASSVIQLISQFASRNILHSEYWGLRNLSYQIKKNNAAHYYYIQFKSDETVNDNIKDKLSVNDSVIRYLIRSIDQSDVGFVSPNSKTDHQDGVIFDERYKSVLSVLN